MEAIRQKSSNTCFLLLNNLSKDIISSWLIFFTCLHPCLVPSEEAGFQQLMRAWDNSSNLQSSSSSRFLAPGCHINWTRIIWNVKTWLHRNIQMIHIYNLVNKCVDSTLFPYHILLLYRVSLKERFFSSFLNDLMMGLHKSNSDCW